MGELELGNTCLGLCEEMSAPCQLWEEERKTPWPGCASCRPGKVLGAAGAGPICPLFPFIPASPGT